MYRKCSCFDHHKDTLFLIVTNVSLPENSVELETGVQVDIPLLELPIVSFMGLDN